MSQRRRWQNVRFHFDLYTPVVALLAELLLEVAQGETVALHGPPVGDLLTTEEIRHHCLATAHPVASYCLFTLLHPESRQKQKGRVRMSGHPREEEEKSEKKPLTIKLLLLARVYRIQY